MTATGLKVLGAADFLSGELAELPLPPAWRKATRNMLMATAAMQRALNLDPAWLNDNRERMALIIGTCSGELETSAAFLETLSKTGVARPLLFQNSLHNATAGFATIHLNVRGPSFTLSSGKSTPSEAVLLAESLIQEGLTDVCLVCLVEGNRHLAEMVGAHGIIEGACALVLASAGTAAKLGRADAPDLDREQALRDYAVPLENPPFYKIDQCGFYAEVRRLRDR